MEPFIQKYEDKVIGKISGFDRLVFRGTLRSLAVVSGMCDFLYRIGVLLKEFGQYVQDTSETLKQASLEAARRQGRPIRYLAASSIRKETVARDIAQADSVAEGLICVLTCVEPCMSYEIYRDKLKKKLVLEPRQRKCLHLYHYWIDPLFGFMNARIQTWFPFTIQVCVNGREYLSRQMDRCRLSYERSENCFRRIQDVPTAQKLIDDMLTLSWPDCLNRIAAHLNPAHHQIFNAYQADYYWSVHQSEWATDIMFHSPAALAAIYPSLLHQAILGFSSDDVMRFLGKKLHGGFTGQVVSDCKKRPEGVRIKHCYNTNSVKMYDKQGSVLRVETTLNEVRDFKVYRPHPDHPGGACGWQRMRKGVADLHRRARLSDTANTRYLEALSQLDGSEKLGTIVQRVCRRRVWKKQPVRGIKPGWADDSQLLEAISRGEFMISGFRNRDIAKLLFPQPSDNKKLCKKEAAKVTYRLRMLRAHGIIRKIVHTNRYLVTAKGRRLTMTLAKIQHLSLEQLNNIAA